MAPLRRYLRITKYSVLEVRIYLDKPSDASWLLSTPRDSNSIPILRQILTAVRPYVLPKLREENEHARNKTAGGARTKSKKKRGIKDVVITEDFEVTIFLTELSTRHSLLTKSKTFAEKKTSLKTTGKGLTGWLNSGKEEGDAIRIDDEDEEETTDLNQIPEAETAVSEEQQRDDEALFVSSSDEDFHQTQREQRARKRRRKDDDTDTGSAGVQDEVGDADDKKKLGLSTTFDGFSIYGRILCLVVKRKSKRAVPDTTIVGSSQMMEKWVSTQAVQEAGLDEEEEG